MNQDTKALGKLSSVMEFDPKSSPLKIGEKIDALWGHVRLEECLSQYPEELESEEDFMEAVKRCLETEYIIRGRVTGGVWNQIPGPQQEEGHELLVIICGDRNFAARIIDGLEFVAKFATQKEIVVLPRSWSQQSERRLQTMTPSFCRAGIVATFVKFPISAPMRGFTCID